MKISVVVPSLNMAQYLEECLESVFSQRYQDFEVILVDGYSSDATLNILRRYEKEYPDKFYWTYAEPHGEPDAINKGMESATGEILTYCDADDVYEPWCFEEITRVFEQGKQWAYGRAIIIDENGIEVRKPITAFKSFFSRRYSYNRLLAMNFINSQCIFWRREMLKDIGYLNVDLKYCFDYDYLLRLGAKFTPGFVNKRLARYRIYPQSISIAESKYETRQALEVCRKYAGKRYFIRFWQYVVYVLVTSVYTILNFSMKQHTRV